jgi:hypothetical protein
MFNIQVSEFLCRCISPLADAAVEPTICFHRNQTICTSDNAQWTGSECIYNSTMNPTCERHAFSTITASGTFIFGILLIDQCSFAQTFPLVIAQPTHFRHSLTAQSTRRQLVEQNENAEPMVRFLKNILLQL